jgi:hypothetical protein
VSDEQHTPETIEPAAAEQPTNVGPDADPRLRPPDPAGTQPKWDPEELLPRRGADPRPASGALWDPYAPEGDTEKTGAGHDHEDAGVAVAAAVHQPKSSKYAARFQFALGALLAVGLAAVALLVAVLVGTSSDDNKLPAQSGPRWSIWHPVAGGDDGPTQIANHVGHEYRLPDDKQLVLVTGGPLEVEVASGVSVPLTVAMRSTSGDIKLFNGSGVLYRMCGLGPKCSISEGKPSVQRHLLLRREALELALYSFRYLPVDEAVVFLPPKKGDDPSQALFFRRSDGDVRNAVVRPLSATLTSNTPSISRVAQSPDAQLVQDITIAKLFHFSLTPANQEARAFLVLDPLKR